MRFRILAAAAALALPLLAGACAEDDEQLFNPPASAGNELFARYVAVGNSITAGFQSAGINDSTQQLAYPALLAGAAGAQYYYASLQGRGCPAPFVNNVTQERVGGGGSGDCDLRAIAAQPWLSNVAVPGATSFSPLDNLIPQANSNALTTFILGGRTQLEAMADAHPTLVTAWIGNNDVLGALTSSTNPGDSTRITPQAVFEANYGTMLDAIEATGASAALVGVLNVTLSPYASLAAIYYCLTYDDDVQCMAPLPTTPNPNLAGLEAAGFWAVDGSCAPGGAGLGTLVPWTKALPKLAAAAGGVAQTLDCTVTEDVVTPAEVARMVTALTQFNAYIEAQAGARGMAWFDPNPALAELRATGEIPAIPDFAPALAGQPISFGNYVSLDGVHPATAAHRVVADSLASVINATFGTSLPVPVAP